ncbi:MAG: hypothetical protein UT63_C0058G0011 [Candidatus Gottesmanbacteria bacterium GW2011_GWC2_39_8]|uniref:Uncharacterized protein n=1 Tax=Candidatus Gottesmanbacteria bacterium GW2011_GWC2_39_8 TaxID=1618450 RepID=A0A0G0SAU1_9BACT|nr:MAG: hypothetical protein UT63_C0058G0011 [Candidatus Gottesmanbacteria bacterium GW2011_GWC2_39_8]
MAEIKTKVGSFHLSMTTSRFSGLGGARDAARTLYDTKEMASAPKLREVLKEHEFYGHACHDLKMLGGVAQGWFSVDGYGLRLGNSFYAVRWVLKYNTTRRSESENRYIALGPRNPSSSDLRIAGKGKRNRISSRKK